MKVLEKWLLGPLRVGMLIISLIPILGEGSAIAPLLYVHALF